MFREPRPTQSASALRVRPSVCRRSARNNNNARAAAASNPAAVFETKRTHRAHHARQFTALLCLLTTALFLATALRVPAHSAAGADPLADPDDFAACRAEGQRLVAYMQTAADAVDQIHATIDWADALRDYADHLRRAILEERSDDGAALRQWCESSAQQRGDVLVAFAEVMSAGGRRATRSA